MRTTGIIAVTTYCAALTVPPLKVTDTPYVPGCVTVMLGVMAPMLHR